jgi:lysophospholipase L1-like esterase
MKRTLLFALLLAAAFTAWAGDTIRVACVGNSITFGMGIRDRANNSYPAILGRLLGSPWEVRNYGFSARTLLMKGDLPYMKEKMYQDALAYNPNVVIIKLGTNDTKPQNWKFNSEFKQDLTTMVERFKKLPVKPRIFLCYPATAYAVTWGINDSIIVHGVIPYVDAVAKSTRSVVIDLHSVTSGMPENFPDKIHPNEIGAKVMAEAVCKALLNDSQLKTMLKKQK